MRKILIAVIALCAFSAEAFAESLVYGRPSPDQVRVRVGSPEFTTTVRVPFPRRDDGFGHHRGYGYDRMHRHSRGCGHPMPIMPARCGSGCAQPRYVAQPRPMPQPMRASGPSVDCEAMGGIRTMNPMTGRPSCFVPN